MRPATMAPSQAFIALPIVFLALWAGISAAQSTEIVVESTGVGIGTATPDDALHIVSDGTPNVGMLRVENSNTTPLARDLFFLSNDGPTRFRFENRSTGLSWRFNAANDGLRIATGTPGVVELTVFPGGNALIAGDLTVTGDVFSTTCEAPNSPCAPDFVFDADYELRPLDEVERFIRENRHLPNVPSGKELVGPINMSRLQMTLLEKIEELTLYAIELHQTNRALAAEIETLKTEIAKATSRE